MEVIENSPTLDDFTGLSEGVNCAATDGPNGKDSTCFQNMYYAEDKREFYWTKGFYLKITENTFDGNYTGNLMSFKNWTNLQISGNTIINN